MKHPNVLTPYARLFCGIVPSDHPLANKELSVLQNPKKKARVPKPIKQHKDRVLNKYSDNDIKHITDMRNANESIKSIAEKMGLTVNAAACQIRKLEKQGKVKKLPRFSKYDKYINDVYKLKKKGIMSGEISKILGINSKAVTALQKKLLEKGLLAKDGQNYVIKR